MSNRQKLIPELRFPEFKNEGEWNKDIVDNLVLTITPLKKLSSSNYQENGKFPIIDQSKNYYCGWTNDNEAIITNNLPLIIFGDHTCIIKIAKEPFAQGADGIKILKAKDKIFPEYLFHYLKHNEVVMEDYKRHYSILKDKVVVYPNIDSGEQQKIASCLSSLDEVIETHSQKLDLLRDHKKGLMQNLFPQEGEKVPKFRFKEFENDGEWVKKSLIDTADKKVKWSFTGGPFGSNLKASDYTSEGIRIIQLQNIGDGEFNDEYKIYTSVEKADELLSCNIHAGEIILSKMGDPVGRACIIPDTLKRCVMASDGIRLVVNETKYSKYFVYSLINSKHIREAIENKATGSTRKRIGLDELRNVELLIPKSLTEQIKIASCLSALDELITAQAEKIDQLKLHKKGLMQGLFPKMID